MSKMNDFHVTAPALEPKAAPGTPAVATTVDEGTTPGLDSLLPSPTSRRRKARVLAIAAVAILLVAAAFAIALLGDRHVVDQPHFVTEPVTRGDLAVAVSADGTLQPTRSVNIGSELSGTIAEVRVDINDRVKKGQVLAVLDTAKLQDQIARSRAALASAEAKVAQSLATVTEARANLGRMQEVQRLSGGKVPSKAELDTAQAVLARATADEAAARATVADARAALSSDATSLAKASIRSPIDGVVLTRSVDPGNAVAASLQAVTLFTLAEDLSRMKLQVNVDEADVGKVRDGQAATFTVAAWANRRYPAQVTRVGYGATTKENVVTYTAEMRVDNADLSLRPGMTATATVDAAKRSSVLLVPNAALRFTPTATAAAPQRSSAGPPASFVSQLMPRPPTSGTPQKATTTASGRQVWVLRAGAPVAVAVVPGLSDGRRTEVENAQLREGDLVITDQGAAAAK